VLINRNSYKGGINGFLMVSDDERIDVIRERSDVLLGSLVERSLANVSNEIVEFLEDLREEWEKIRDSEETESRLDLFLYLEDRHDYWWTKTFYAPQIFPRIPHLPFLMSDGRDYRLPV